MQYGGTLWTISLWHKNMGNSLWDKVTWQILCCLWTDTDPCSVKSTPEVISY